MNDISNKLCDFNIKEGTVIFDENKNTSWLNQIAIGELYDIKQSRVSQIINELREDGLIDNISNTNIVKNGRNKTTFYDIEAVKYIGVRTRSNVGIRLQEQLVELSEGLRKGELELIDMKNVLNNIALKPTTTYRQKRNEHLLNNGLLDIHVETRCFNVKLTSELSEMIRKLGYGNYLRIINRKFADAIYSNGINEFDLVNDVTNPHNRRDYCNFDQLTVTQCMSAKLVEKLVNHIGEITLNVLMDYVDDCVMIGLAFSDILVDNGGISVTINPRQSSLDTYYKK